MWCHGAQPVILCCDGHVVVYKEVLSPTVILDDMTLAIQVEIGWLRSVVWNGKLGGIWCKYPVVQYFSSLLVWKFGQHVQPSPFVAGWYGEDVTCLIPFLLTNSWNSRLVKAVLLSVTSISGNPWVENMWRNLLVAAWVEVDETTCTSSHSEYVSINKRKLFPRNGPAKSAWSLAQGRSSNSQGCRGALEGCRWCSWRCGQWWTSFFSALSNPGHQM